MSKFKAGDKVRCVDQGGGLYLTRGKIYTCLGPDGAADHVNVLANDGITYPYMDYRFELVTEDADPKNFFVVETEDGRYSRRFETWSQVEKYVGGLEETCVVYSRYAKMTPETKVKVEYV